MLILIIYDPYGSSAWLDWYNWENYYSNQVRQHSAWALWNHCIRNETLQKTIQYSHNVINGCNYDFSTNFVKNYNDNTATTINDDNIDISVDENDSKKGENKKPPKFHSKISMVV